MSKEKVKRENEKAILQEKHAEQLTQIQGAANQKMVIGIIASTLLTLAIAYFMMSQGAAAGGDL